MRKHFSTHFESESEVKVAQPCPTLCNHMDYTVHGILQARILDCRPFPSPGDRLNPGFEHRPPALQVDSLQLSHKRSPRILEWVAYPFSSGSSQPSKCTRISCIAGYLDTKLSKDSTKEENYTSIFLMNIYTTILNKVLKNKLLCIMNIWSIYQQ